MSRRHASLDRTQSRQSARQPGSSPSSARPSGHVRAVERQVLGAGSSPAARASARATRAQPDRRGGRRASRSRPPGRRSARWRRPGRSAGASARAPRRAGRPAGDGRAAARARRCGARRGGRARGRSRVEVAGRPVPEKACVTTIASMVATAAGRAAQQRRPHGVAVISRVSEALPAEHNRGGRAAGSRGLARRLAVGDHPAAALWLRRRGPDGFPLATLARHGGQGAGNTAEAAVSG